MRLRHDLILPQTSKPANFVFLFDVKILSLVLLDAVNFSWTVYWPKVLIVFSHSSILFNCIVLQFQKLA